MIIKKGQNDNKEYEFNNIFVNGIFKKIIINTKMKSNEFKRNGYNLIKRIPNTFKLNTIIPLQITFYENQTKMYLLPYKDKNEFIFEKQGLYNEFTNDYGNFIIELI